LSSAVHNLSLYSKNNATINTIAKIILAYEQTAPAVFVGKFVLMITAIIYDPHNRQKSGKFNFLKKVCHV
jgi:hypothetical protein